LQLLQNAVAIQFLVGEFVCVQMCSNDIPGAASCAVSDAFLSLSFTDSVESWNEVITPSPSSVPSKLPIPSLEPSSQHSSRIQLQQTIEWECH
jgi:hypothetical protein